MAKGRPYTASHMEASIAEMEKEVAKHQAVLDGAKFTQFAPIFKRVQQYVQQHKLIVYGGTALNQILPPKDRFYAPTAIPDYDCFSYKAKYHAIRLANQLSAEGHTYVYVKRAIHPGTFRVYVHFSPVIDITFVPKAFYTRLVALAQKDYSLASMPFVPAPLHYLIYSMHHELSRPMVSMYRWTKVFKRLMLLENALMQTPPDAPLTVHPAPDPQMVRVFEHALAFGRRHKLPIGGTYAILSAMKQARPEAHLIHPSLPFVEMMSMHAQTAHEQLLSSLRTAFPSDRFLSTYRTDGSTFTLYYDEHFSPVDTPIVPPCYDIQMKHANKWYRIAIIYNGELECLTYHPTKRLFSVDTLLRFLYAYEFLFDDNTKDHRVLKDLSRRCAYALKWDTPYFRTTPSKRFMDTCFGTDKSLLSLHKIRWDKKIQIVIHIPKQRKTIKPTASKTTSSGLSAMGAFFSV